MTTPLRVLFIEDSEDDMLLQLRELRQGGYGVSHHRVETAEALRQALAEGPWDLIISDYSLPRFTGRVAVGAERDDDRVPALANKQNYSLDVGAAYDVTRRIAVTGGVRYNIERDRTALVNDNRRDSQAVYVGTAFKF